jgi:hypothetical protein
MLTEEANGKKIRCGGFFHLDTTQRIGRDPVFYKMATPIVAKL